MSLASVVDKGREALIGLQNEEGCFPAHAFTESHSRSMLSPAVFPTALVLTALAPLRRDPGERWQEMLRRGVLFLKDEQAPNGSFNYWQKQPRNHAASTNPRCPNDMDDTSLALATLCSYGDDLPDGDLLARLVRLLTAIEHQEGGPYNTWIIDFKKDPVWQECDLAVNANIAYALSVLEVSLPNLIDYFETAITNDDLRSTYYRSPLVILYFIARSYRGPLAARAREKIMALKTQEGHWGSPLHTALALSTLMRWGDAVSDHEQAIAYLLQAQSAGGTWTGEEFYLEQSRKGEAWYVGSEAITTAHCLEALVLADRSQPMATLSPDVVSEEVFPIPDGDARRSEMINAFLELCDSSAPSLAPLARTFIAAILKDRFWSQSMLLPLAWRNAMQGQGLSVPEEAAFQLGVAHLFGLAAYHISDDIVDGEANPILLPFVNFALRMFIVRYSRLLAGVDDVIVHRILAGIEEAIYKESATKLVSGEKGYSLTPLPAYEDLVCAEKSLGQALPAIAVMLLAGFPSDSAKVDHTVHFFRHYLSARQWNDDAHDILEDIGRGRVTPAGWHTLSFLKECYPDIKEVDVLLHKQRILEVFWARAFERVAQAINDHVAQAWNHLGHIGLGDSSYLEGLLKDQEDAMHRIGQERDRMLAFIKTYTASA